MIARCILCSLMIVINIRNNKQLNTPKDNEKSMSILDENDNINDNDIVKHSEPPKYLVKNENIITIHSDI